MVEFSLIQVPRGSTQLPDECRVVAGATAGVQGTCSHMIDDSFMFLMNP